MVFASKEGKAWRLGHVYGFGEFCIQVRVFDIHLFYLPVVLGGEGEDDTGECEFGHWCIGFIIIHTEGLSESLGN